MPAYSWRNKKTGVEVDVIRAFSEYEQPPTSVELGTPEASYDPTEWERIIKGKPTVTKPWNWGSKGNWILALVLMGIGGCRVPTYPTAQEFGIIAAWCWPADNVLSLVCRKRMAQCATQQKLVTCIKEDLEFGTMTGR